LAWTVSYTTLSNPKFGVESIEFSPGVQNTNDVCFGTLTDGCTFDPQISLKQAGIMAKEVCDNIPIIGLHIVGYELSYPKRRKTLARLVNNEGSGGQDSAFALMFATDRDNLCNWD
jgi:hypothetical protein